MNWIKISETGALKAGASDCRINHESAITITFVGTTNVAEHLGGFGTKGIAVLGECSTVVIHNIFFFGDLSQVIFISPFEC